MAETDTDPGRSRWVLHQANQRRVVDTLCGRGTCTRAELARATGQSAARASSGVPAFVVTLAGLLGQQGLYLCAVGIGSRKPRSCFHPQNHRWWRGEDSR